MRLIEFTEPETVTTGKNPTVIPARRVAIAVPHIVSIEEPEHDADAGVLSIVVTSTHRWETGTPYEAAVELLNQAIGGEA